MTGQLIQMETPAGTQLISMLYLCYRVMLTLSVLSPFFGTGWLAGKGLMTALYQIVFHIITNIILT